MSETGSTSRTTREEFLGRIRAALEHGETIAPREAAPAVDEAIVRLARVGDDLVGLFVKRAAESGMMAERLAGANLLKRIGEVVAEVGAKRAVVSVGTVPQALGLKDSLRRKGVEVVDWAATPGLEAQYDTDVGITDMHAAIAETGTIVYWGDAGHSRGLSLVPPVHIAVVRESEIIPDLIDFWARMKGSPGVPGVPAESWPSGMVLITGPSKTADIEGVLVTGVHGPGKVFVMVVEG